MDKTILAVEDGQQYIECFGCGGCEGENDENDCWHPCGVCDGEGGWWEDVDAE